MEILGLLDTLESVILDGFKVPFSKKIIIQEEEVLAILDKIRLVAQSGAGTSKKATDRTADKQVEVIVEEPVRQKTMEAPATVTDRAKAQDIVQQSYQISKEIREGADKYADEVLSNLEATTTRILRTVKAGRERLQVTVQNSSEGASKIA